MNTAKRKLQDAGVSLEPDDLRAPHFALLALIGDTRASQVPPTEGATDGAAFLIGDWFAPTPSRPLHATRCAATAKATGRRCRRWSVIGFERCYVHSGYGRLQHSVAYRQRVLERARQRLLGAPVFLVESSMDQVTDPDATPAQTLRACIAVLDAIGLTRRSETRPEPRPRGRRRAADRLVRSAEDWAE